LKEAVPNLSRVALLLDLFSPNKEGQVKANQTAAEALGISLWPAEISAPDEIEPVFSKIAQDRADAVMRGAGRYCLTSGRVLARRPLHIACQ
jgi:putative ABC transport system substrate-binding protein